MDRWKRPTLGPHDMRSRGRKRYALFQTRRLSGPSSGLRSLWWRGKNKVFIAEVTENRRGDAEKGFISTDNYFSSVTSVTDFIRLGRIMLSYELHQFSGRSSPSVRPFFQNQPNHRKDHRRLHHRSQNVRAGAAGIGIRSLYQL